MSPDGELLASGSRDRTVRLWRLPSGKAAGTLTGHTDWVTCLAVSPDGGLLASGSLRGARSWRLPSGEPADTIDGAEAITCLAVSPDGELACGKDASLVLWRRHPVGKFVGLSHGGGGGQCLAVSPDRGLLASGGRYGKVLLQWLPSGEYAGTLAAGRGTVSCLLMSPDGRLTSASSGGGMRVWRSKLAVLRRTPVDQISLAGIARLRPPSGEHPDGANVWIEFITTLVRWRHRFDIEVDTAPGAVAADAADIELDS